jgi:transcriptional regulator with XRE-family HTH domain
MREAKKLSQGDIERRTGLFRSYTSRVENGHNIPTVQTLEKYAQAFGVPVYELLYGGKEPMKKLPAPKQRTGGGAWGARGNEQRELRLFAHALARMTTRNRKLLLVAAQWLASRNDRSRVKPTRR